MSFRLFFEVFAEVEGERVNGRRRNLNVGTDFRWILKKKSFRNRHKSSLKGSKDIENSS